MDIVAIDREIAGIEKSIRLLAYLKPVNLSLERTLFLKGKRRNPLFRYRSLRFSPDELRARLQSLALDSTSIGHLLRKKVAELYSKIALLKAIGTNNFTAASEALYGTIDETMEKNARDLLARIRTKNPSKKKYRTGEVKAALEKTLQQYGLTHWKIRVKEHLVSAVAAGKRNAIFLRNHVIMPEPQLKRIIAHEIETHLLTAENAKYQPYKLFQRGFAHYLETQEGMAIYAQEHFNHEPEGVRRISFATLAVSYALRTSFRDVHQRMRDLGLSEKKAFRMAVRVKRGMTDTGRPGAFTKDSIYLKGLRRIEEFVDTGGDLKKLYVGKIALEDLPFISNLPGIVPPRHLPHWLA